MTKREVSQSEYHAHFMKNEANFTAGPWKVSKDGNDIETIDGAGIASLYAVSETQDKANAASNSIANSLRRMKVSGNIVSLPPKSEGEILNYSDVRAALLNAGAKYKKNTFVFPNDAQPYIDRLCGGEKVNIKKEFQFFATPDSLADTLVYEADIQNHHKILEPSAGQGSIIKAIRRVNPNVVVDWCELMDINRNVVKGLSNQNYLGEDFLTTEIGVYDLIIANPPFSKNQDIDHIYKMVECLSRGGRLVTIASKHWQVSSGKKETEFKRYLESIGAEVSDIEAGEFSESGTKIATCMIILNKPL